MRELTDDELEAIGRFAAAHGRKWKYVLASTYWCNARPWRGPNSEPNDGGILHGLRNDPNWGHEGLEKFKLRIGPQYTAGKSNSHAKMIAALAKAFDRAATKCSTADMAARFIEGEMEAAGYKIVRV